ncbi:hypothetical protein I6N90_24405 [Paenibacillus sp. GSMTC-2017]|uniref:hypothetical protein n=1 Tax=Paenibacillus sp. GSMTC-2017 TaxID=2794350 RepID=UPI0018D7D7F0|nr:hypothetical protein [Paenibacillus sp. GSMTC-2017]MBH5320932.1 hypothetical protein [Paenibacillus sp. GSMTC-2017]
MLKKEEIVTTVEELVIASMDSNIFWIIVSGEIVNAPTIQLSRGQSLRGENRHAIIIFSNGTDGLQISSDNEIHNIQLVASQDKRVLFNDPDIEHLGRIGLYGVTAVGQVQILAFNKVRGGHIEVNGLDIVSADTRSQQIRPKGFGVSVTQGAFTLWNMQPEEDVIISADLRGISAGRNGAPILGSAIFVSGAGAKGGHLVVQRLETNAVYNDGKIPPGTADQITGGVFTGYNAYVDLVRNRGPVVTHGVNDMVLDNWGYVKQWIAEEKITSFGPSSIGFVNFGIVNDLRIYSPIETFGQGARGFNVYVGTIQYAEFDRITTHGNGAVGVQISQPVGRLIVRRGIETFGSIGQSLVQGVIENLSAIGLSIKSGGGIGEVHIYGGIKTYGRNVPPFEMNGVVHTLKIEGGLIAAGGV